ncbi:MAG: MalY/PatB family protein [Fusobacteriaceae bacterium]
MKYNFDEIVNRAGTYARKWECDEQRKYPDYLPFTTADMDIKCPPEIINAMKRLSENGIYGYTYKSEEVYKAIISWNKRRNNSGVSKEDIVFMNGVVPALYYTIQIFSEVGDKIIVQNPVYPPIIQGINKNKRVLLENTLKLVNGSYEIDFQEFESFAKDSKTKIFVLCNPHNPSGKVFTEEELAKLGKICVENNVLILADEIHSDVVFHPYKHVVMADISEEIKNNIITCRSVSKTFNLAGLYSAYAIIKNKAIRDKITNFMENIAAGEHSSFSIEGLKVAYDECEEWVDELLVYLKGNLDFIEKYLEENLPKIKMIKPQGTYMVFLDFNEYKDIDYKKVLLDEAHVGLKGGEEYGSGGENFMRFCFASPRALIEEGLVRIKNAFEKY